MTMAKLLQEANFDLKPIEAEGDLFFEGIFMQLNLVNRNNRFYPAEDIAPIVEEYIREQVA